MLVDRADRASAWGSSGSNDTNPKQTTIYHAAGLGGRGGSSYIDGVILADKDMTNGWVGAADGTREKRVYLLQNWRADVSCVTDQNGKVVEWVKYSPYGVPFRIDPADFDRDGDVDAADSSAFTTEYNNGGPRADTNHDGFIDFTDYDVYMDNYAAASAGGRNVLSRGGSTSAGIHNRIGYAGYLWDSATSQYHVRNRVFLPSLGRWSRRDPIGYVDGLSVYEYVQDMPVNAVDPQGLRMRVWCGSSWCVTVVTISWKHSDYHLDKPATQSDPGPGWSWPDRSLACRAFCNLNTFGRWGVTMCDGKTPFRCICDQNVDNFQYTDNDGTLVGGDSDFLKHWKSCLETHEQVHVGDADCSQNPKDIIGLTAVPAQYLDCSEAAAYDAEIACIAAYPCRGSSVCDKTKQSRLNNATAQRDLHRGKCPVDNRPRRLRGATNNQKE